MTVATDTATHTGVIEARRSCITKQPCAHGPKRFFFFMGIAAFTAKILAAYDLNGMHPLVAAADGGGGPPRKRGWGMDGNHGALNRPPS